LLSADPTRKASPGASGAEVFGYGEAFARELSRLGQISTEEFAALYPPDTNYLPGISWDPTTARFWDLFNADPNAVNAGKSWGDPGCRTLDYRLSLTELEVFKRNGFVVSKRLGENGRTGRVSAGSSPISATTTLPVFISTDAILHAWHRSYSLMLMELEHSALHSSTMTLLAGMTEAIASAEEEVGAGVLRDSLMDADYLIAVAPVTHRRSDKCLLSSARMAE
jgi:hypothetical protein